MTRLPTPGGDDGDWGNILNDFLSVSHNADGTLKPGSVPQSALSVSGATSGQILSSDGTNFTWATIPKITVASTAPQNPNVGDIWIDLSS